MEQTHPLELWLAKALPVAAVLSGALFISMLSGYHRVETPIEVSWQFSPLGLLLGFKKEYLDLKSQSFFQGYITQSYDYFRMFMITCLLESPFYLFLLRSRGLLFSIAVLCVANFLTHPMVFFVFPYFFHRYLLSALASELFAALAEILFVILICRLGEQRNPSALACTMIVLLANLFSWQIGIYF